MSDVLLVALVALAALACPVHMWWMHRRGRQALCCPPKRAPERATPDDAATLRARRAEIEARLAEVESDAGRAADSIHTRA
jgi:hypothetical protein